MNRVRQPAAAQPAWCLKTLPSTSILTRPPYSNPSRFTIRPLLQRPARAAYLQRARFLAIAEFGPGSLIYHEGRAYRVYKAKLPAGVRSEEGGRLATSTIYVCDECGAGHEHDEPERCHVCASPIAGIHPIRNVMRIDNVETKPAERNTPHDEDRQRRGFEIQTIFAWPRRDGLLDVAS